MNKLKGKIALVTGGGTGIGRAVSLSLAREGASVAINFSKSSTDAAKTLAEVKACGASGSTVQADVSSDRQVRDMVQRVQKEYGRIDILVNNAGMTRFIPHSDLEAMDEEVWDRTFAVNLKGAFFCCRAVAPVMKSQGRGRIVNVASVAGLTGQGSSIAYCASKAALICMTKSLARVLGPEVGVNAVAPGLIDTRWLGASSDPDGIRERYKNNSVLKRVGTPDDIAEVVLALASESSFVTGQVVVADGGISL